MIFQIAVRNLFSNFLNIVIGLIIFFGTLLVVVGGSLLNSVDSAMSRSVIGSVAGHLQVYSEKSKDELALYGNFSFPDISAIPDFSAIKGPLLSLPNVQAVIPMGVNGASVPYGNTMDMTLEKLRKSINKKIAGDRSEDLKKQIESHKNHVQQMVALLKTDSTKLALMAKTQSFDMENKQHIDRANSEEFWNHFEKDPLGSLEFLENRIASLIPDADFIQLSYVGTDLEAFSQSFDRMEVVDGQKVPSGKRGLLLSKYVYENQFKLKTARRLDKIHEAIEDAGKSIAKDPDLQQFVKQNRNQTREIVLQLDSISGGKLVSRLQSFLNSKETDVTALLNDFLNTQDSNFEARYQFFYSDIAPLLELYRLRPGDVITIKAFTKGGFVQSVNMKVYGTFRFKGLEKSGLAGSLSLMDIMSFRDLYGFVTPEKIAETQALQKSVGAKIMDRDQAEAEMFGSATSGPPISIVKVAKQEVIREDLQLASGKKDRKNDSSFDRIYSLPEIENGVVLNAAIILKDPSKISETQAEIEALSKRDHLELKVLTWQKAAGTIGQLVLVAKVVLYSAVFIIFVVALVIINNAVMMATLQRIREIGTMRAIGAQKSFILQMILVETVMLGMVFGTGGIFAGSGIIGILGKLGIPAKNEFLYFFFSGPRLFPSLTLAAIVTAFIIIFIVTLFSTLYPAILATQVSPLKAMQAEE